MDNNKFNNEGGRSSIAKIIGFFLLALSILMFVGSISSYFNWQSKSDKYVKKYVYSELGLLSYEESGNNVYVDEIYDTKFQKIDLEIPDTESVLMYCSKEKNNSCIYFNTDNATARDMLNPLPSIFIALFFGGLGFFMILKKGNLFKVDNDNKSQKAAYGLFTFLFVVGMTLIIWQLIGIFDYLALKGANNKATATISSCLYIEDDTNGTYKPISYYYVAGERYEYVEDVYVDGSLEENLGKTFEVYYDKKKPSHAAHAIQSTNMLMIVCGGLLVVIGLYPIIFKKKIKERLNNITQREQEWKI